MHLDAGATSAAASGSESGVAVEPEHGGGTAAALPSSRHLSIDIAFNDPLAVEEAAFFQRTVAEATGGAAGSAGSAAAIELLLFIKYWSKLNRINEPKHGTLSSFGWRCIATSVLMELGLVPCLRQGFHLMDADSPPPRVDGVSIAFGAAAPKSTSATATATAAGLGRKDTAATATCTAAAAGDGGSASAVGPVGGAAPVRGSWPALLFLARELERCVGPRDTVRVFQMVTTNPAELDRCVAAMLPASGNPAGTWYGQAGSLVTGTVVD